MKVLFLTSAHSSTDDRIFHHQARALSQDHKVWIYSTFAGDNIIEHGIEAIYDQTVFIGRKAKINAFEQACERVSPDVVICSEPIPILGAEQYRKRKSILRIRIYYDVTEFYPSKKNLHGLKGVKRFIKMIAMVWLNKKASSKVDGFIFGEHFKSLFYKAHFKHKPSIELPYYQDSSFFKSTAFLPELFTIGYTGKFSEEKGILRFADVLKKFSENQGDNAWRVILIGWFENKQVESEFNKRTEGLPIEVLGNLPYSVYCESLAKFSVFLDLRDTDAENNLCLPIKLFTYASAGRPIIYSAIHAIEFTYGKHNFISCKRADDLQGIVEKLMFYYQNKVELELACQAASAFSIEHRWETIKDDFVRFVTVK
jgi:glycosyltransferase involved in cell wall biosynthesis